MGFEKLAGKIWELKLSSQAELRKVSNREMDFFNRYKHRQIMPKKRCIVYPKDVQNITGRSERYGQLLLQKIRVFHNKKPHQFVTIQEFSDFSGIPPGDISDYLY